MSSKKLSTTVDFEKSVGWIESYVTLKKNREGIPVKADIARAHSKNRQGHLTFYLTWVRF
jgi:hypothetical protein